MIFFIIKVEKHEVIGFRKLLVVIENGHKESFRYIGPMRLRFGLSCLVVLILKENSLNKAYPNSITNEKVTIFFLVIFLVMQITYIEKRPVLSVFNRPKLLDSGENTIKPLIFQGVSTLSKLISCLRLIFSSTCMLS